LRIISMTSPREELLSIISGIRTYLEYQQALGVRSIEMPEVRPAITSRGLTPVQPDRPAVSLPANTVQPQSALISVSAELEAVRKELGECTRCKLAKGRSSIVFGEGSPQARIMFIGEGPGNDEDEQGRQFGGAAGQLLTDIIVKGMKPLREDVYICNIVKCRPPENRNPEPDEIDACGPFLRKQIQAIKPLVIVALGNVAVKTLLNTQEGITSLRGKWRSCDGIPLMPTFHPAYLLRNPSGKKLVWEDIQQVMAKMAGNRSQ